MKNTKIICTIGPSSDDVEILVAMMEAGMDVARLNFSHGTHGSKKKTIERIREAREKAGKEIPILCDTKGPEIRTGHFEGDVLLPEGGEIIFVCDYENTLETGKKSSADRIYLSYEGLPDDVSAGDRIMLDDGQVITEVISIDGNEIKVKTIQGGIVTSRRGVNVPGANLNLPGLSDKDKEDIRFCLRHDIDFVALSFTRTARNVLETRELLESEGCGDVKIISKIENQEGMDNIEEILDVSDGLMVARGDLGVEIDFTSVPAYQKDMIDKALHAGKIVVTATEMLNSMKASRVPTRAEVSDVYNAVRQSSTCLMLSGETANGKYPVESVHVMASIIMNAEQEKTRIVDYSPSGNISNAISYGVVASADSLNAKVIVAYTESGRTARTLSAYRPEVPILVISPNRKVLRQSNMLWGVVPYMHPSKESLEELFSDAESIVIESGLAEEGDNIVVVAGTPVGMPGTTNTLRGMTIGKVLARGKSLCPGTAEGIVRICASAEESASLKEGEVGVVFRLEKGYSGSPSGLIVHNYDKDALENYKGIPIISTENIENVEEGKKVRILSEKGVVVEGF